MKKVLSIISMVLLIFLVGCSSKDNSTTNNSQNTSIRVKKVIKTKKIQLKM